MPEQRSTEESVQFSQSQSWEEFIEDHLVDEKERINYRHWKMAFRASMFFTVLFGIVSLSYIMGEGADLTADLISYIIIMMVCGAILLFSYNSILNSEFDAKTIYYHDIAYALDRYYHEDFEEVETILRRINNNKSNYVELSDIQRDLFNQYVGEIIEKDRYYLKQTFPTVFNDIIESINTSGATLEEVLASEDSKKSRPSFIDSLISAVDLQALTTPLGFVFSIVVVIFVTIISVIQFGATYAGIILTAVAILIGLVSLYN